MSTATLTVTAKGQVTLRRSVLEHLGVRPGDRVEVSLAPGGKVELAPAKPKHDISVIFGMLHRPGQRALTQEEIDDAIADSLVEKDERIRREWAAAQSAKRAEPHRRARRG